MEKFDSLRETEKQYFLGYGEAVQGLGCHAHHLPMVMLSSGRSLYSIHVFVHASVAAVYATC